MVIDIKESPDKRPKRERSFVGIIIHHTGISGVKNIRDESQWAKWYNSMVHWLTKKDDSYLSAHYVIARDGRITMCVNPDTHEAFHAGKSEYWHPEKRKRVTDWNRYAIGIELVGDGNIVSYSEPQYKSLIELCRYLVDRYPDISPVCIIGHENVATPDGRKPDPGKLFDWKKLMKGIYGGG